MVRLAKRLAVLAVAGTLTATSLTGCGTINTDETVATVGDEKITLGVANFYARLQQAQYETYYASMMGTTAEEMWAKEVSVVSFSSGCSATVAVATKPSSFFTLTRS